jgi:hypothetical protein
LPGGTIEATLNEIYGPARAARRAYSASGTIRGGTGQYRDVQGHIRGVGFVSFDRQGRECRKIALRVELEPLE